MSTPRVVLSGVIFLLGVGALAWIGVDQVAWRFMWRDWGYLTALGPVAALATAAFTAAAAVAAVVYVFLTYQLWQQNYRAQQATLMQELMREYDGLREDIRLLQRFFNGKSEAQAVELFRAAKAAPDQHAELMPSLDDARFRVSRFFVKIHKLTIARFLDRQIIIAALDSAAIKVYLNQVQPLDRVIRAIAYGSGYQRDREFFTELLGHYPDKEQMN